MQLLFRYSDSEETLLTLDNQNPSKTSITRLKKLLIEKFAGIELSKTAFKWNLEIDNKLVNDFEAANLKVSNFSKVPRVHLFYKGEPQTKTLQIRKRRADEDIEELMEKIQRTREAPVAYNLTEKLLKLVKDRAIFTSKEDNGMQMGQIFHFFGLIKTHIGTIMNQPLRTFIQTKPNQIIPNVESDIVLRPVFIPQHVSLMCKYGQKRRINIDSSGTSQAGPNVSQTFINYQIFDKTLEIHGGEHLASGNCGIFTVANAIRCIIEYEKYSNMTATLDMFWERLQKIARKSNANIAPLLLDMFTRIYQGRGSTKIPPLPVGMLMNLMYQDLKDQSIDFIADIMMMDLFLELDIGGFENVSLLGNVLRLYLQDLLSSQGKFIGNRQNAGALQLSAWILLREIEPSTDELETLETYMFDNVVSADMDIDEFEKQYGKFPMKMAQAVLQHFFKDSKTGGQMLARKFLHREPRQEQKSLLIQYHAELPIPEGTFQFAHQLFDRAAENKDIYQRLIRVPRALFEQSIGENGALVVLHNVRTNIATMARIEGIAESLEVSPLVAESLEDLQGPIAVKLYKKMGSVQFIRFQQLEGDSANLREALESRIDWVPGLVAGEVLNLANKAKVQVKELLIDKIPVRFATIETGEIQFEVDPICNHCGSMAPAKICGGCREVHYCDAECQRMNWKHHEKLCINK